jgi:hypothetical protein
MTNINNQQTKTKARIFIQLFVMALVVILFLSGPALSADQKAQFLTELPQTEIPQPQLFCGYCHILTYPEAVQKGYDLWKKSKHKEFGCVECHYPPKGTDISNKTSASNPETVSAHIPKNPPEHFSYIKLGGEAIRTRPRISDASCMTANCHGKPDDKFKTKKIKFTEKVLFVHEPHLDKKKQIEGQQVNCTSCHQHETDAKKFEVSKAACHLCHFKNVRFNRDRGKCTQCHELPTKPIQTSGENPITHKMLQKAKVSCAGCHIELIQAAGGGRYEALFEDGELKTALVLNAGQIKKENCLACHDRAKALKEDHNKKLMHQKHVTIKNARCLDCHQPILHTKADLDQPVMAAYAGSDLSQPKLPGCEACHPQPHRYQRLLSTGPKRPEVSRTPDFMFKARTNCLGCHVEKEFNTKGQIIMKASAKTCVRCHTKDHKKMLKEWKTELTDEIKYGKEIEQEALAALAKAKLPGPRQAEARKMLKQGRENLNIVKFGNGVHNKKYSIMLIDAAITHFEEMIEYLEEGE